MSSHCPECGEIEIGNVDFDMEGNPIFFYICAKCGAEWEEC